MIVVPRVTGMALLKYCKKIPANAAPDIPYPSRLLSLTVPPETITAANRQVRAIQHAKRTGSKSKSDCPYVLCASLME